MTLLPNLADSRLHDLCAIASTRSVKAIFIALLATMAPNARAQTVEILATVTETGGGPVADATVTLVGIDQVNRTAKSDARGNVRFTVDRPGPYNLIPFKEGYFIALPTDPATPPNLVVVTGTAPSVRASLLLRRPGQVGGVVLDEETREPVAGLEVFLVQRQWQLGRAALFVASRPGPIKTDAEGRFTFARDVLPGDYLVATRSPQTPYGVRALKAFSAADRETIDDGHELTFWPGGRDAASALPLHVDSSGLANVGTILVRKVKQYRLHATFTGKCTEDDDILVFVLKRDGGRVDTPTAMIECGEALLLDGLSPGSYGLYAVSRLQNREDLENGFSAFSAFEIQDRNVDLALDLKPVTVIDGELKAPANATGPPIRLPLATHPIELLFGAEAARESFVYWTDERHFRLGLTQGRQRLDFGPVTQAVVRQVRMGDLPLGNNLLPPGTKGALEITMDTQIASITGRVLPSSASLNVLALPDGVPLSELEPFSLQRTAVSPDGSYRLTRLNAGTYRVLAYRSGDYDVLNQPGILENALAQAARVEVGAGETKTVDLRVTTVR